MKKIGLISMVLVLAMGMLGVRSVWADTVVAGETAMTGTGFVGIRNVSTDDPSGSLDPVWNGTEIVTSDKNVASTISTNNGETKILNGETEFYDSVTETINNAYPGYAPTMTMEIANGGPIPVTVIGYSQEITEDYEGLMENFVELHYWSVQRNDDLPVTGSGEQELYGVLGGYRLESGDVATLIMNFLILEKNPWDDEEEFPQGETATLQDTFVFWDGTNIDTTMVTIALNNLPVPGWNKGKKSGWDGSVPPGLEKKDKTPNGFDKGNKAGWE